MSSVQAVSMNLAVQKANEAFKAMQTWPHWSEIARGAEKEYGMSREEFNEVVPEYQRFMALSAAFPGLGMLGERIDILWHSHILNTIRYREFCDQFIGRMIDHLPCSSYAIYNCSLDDARGDMCNIPSSCTDPFPAPPDPSPTPSRYEQMRTSILEGSSRFITAYTQVYGSALPAHLWERASLIAEGIAC